MPIQDPTPEDFRRWLNQTYYWTPEWQADEAESRQEIEAGQDRTFYTADEAIAWLEGEEL